MTPNEFLKKKYHAGGNNEYSLFGSDELRENMQEFADLQSVEFAEWAENHMWSRVGNDWSEYNGLWYNCTSPEYHIDLYGKLLTSKELLAKWKDETK